VSKKPGGSQRHSSFIEFLENPDGRLEDTTANDD
jgi:hypothetical protein